MGNTPADCAMRGISTLKTHSVAQNANQYLTNFIQGISTLEPQSQYSVSLHHHSIF